MKIESGSAKAAEAARHAQKPKSSSEKASGKSTHGAHSKDRVEISDVGRALSGGLAAGETGNRELSVEKVQAIRERITGGGYASPKVDEAVAMAILESGDLE